jgi:hypothetical protein
MASIVYVAALMAVTFYVYGIAGRFWRILLATSYDAA